MLKFLIDENLPFSLVEFLRKKGFQVYRLSDMGLKGRLGKALLSKIIRLTY